MRALNWRPIGMPAYSHVRLTLPYAHEYDFRRRGGRRDWKEVYRSNLQADIRVVDGPFIPVIQTQTDGEPVTCSYGDKLYRQVAGRDGPLSPAEFERYALDDRQRFHHGTYRWWALRDFPRPYYVRSPRLSDRNPTELDRCPVLHEWRPPKLWDARMAWERMLPAQECYERAILVCDDTVWIEVPPPAWVLEPVDKAHWRLRIETRPSLWQAASIFPLTRGGNLIDAREVAEQFAEELAVELLPPTTPVELLGAIPEVNSISSLAAATLAIAGRAFPEVDLSKVDRAEASALVRDALEAVPRPNFPWCPGSKLEGLDARCGPLRLQRRWQFEFRQPENWDLLKELWPDDREIHYRAMANDRNESPTRKTHLEDWEALATLSPY